MSYEVKYPQKVVIDDTTANVINNEGNKTTYSLIEDDKPSSIVFIFKSQIVINARMRKGGQRSTIKYFKVFDFDIDGGSVEPRFMITDRTFTVIDSHSNQILKYSLEDGGFATIMFDGHFFEDQESDEGENENAGDIN